MNDKNEKQLLNINKKQEKFKEIILKYLYSKIQANEQLVGGKSL